MGLPARGAPSLRFVPGCTWGARDVMGKGIHKAYLYENLRCRPRIEQQIGYLDRRDGAGEVADLPDVAGRIKPADQRF